MGEMIQVGDRHKVEAYLVRPEGAVRGAVIVIHEVWGLTEHIKSVADRVAELGYIALAPALLTPVEIEGYTTDELQKALFDPERRNQIQPQMRKLMAPMQDPQFGVQTTAKLQDCFDYLYELPEVHQKVAVMGFCFGGSYSFALAVAEARLAVAIPFYGHADQGVDELKRIACPVRAFYGERDERLISQLPDLKRRFSEAEVNFVETVYPDCGHAFFNDSNPYAYNAKAADDAWEQAQKILEHATS